LKDCQVVPIGGEKTGAKPSERVGGGRGRARL